MEENQTQNPGAAGAAAGGGPRVGWDEIRDVRRLSRPTHDRMVAGVATGLARHLDVDPLLVRIGFVVLAFFGGAGVFLYAALWLVLPEDRTGRAPLQLDGRSRQFALVGILALGALGVMGNVWGGWPFPWLLLVAAGVVVFLLARGSGDRTAPAWQTPGQYYGPAQPYAPQQYPASPGQSYPAQAYPAAYPATSPVPGAASETGSTTGTTAGTEETAPLHGAPLTSPAAAQPGASSTTPFTAVAPSASPTSTAGGPAGPTSWTPSAYGPVPPAPEPRLRRPRDPRKRGPILFWITLALVALGFGVLGMVDVAGVDVPASAYPALVMGTSALMLLVGAFWGRAGGLIALGLVAALVTAGTVTTERWENETVRLTPVSAAEVPRDDSFRTGEYVLDLTRVRDLEALDQKIVHLDGGVGRLEVVVPEGLDVDVTSEVGVGELEVLDGGTQEGVGLSYSYGASSGAGAPVLHLALELGVGELRVVRPQDASRRPLWDGPDAATDTTASTEALPEGALR